MARGDLPGNVEQSFGGEGGIDPLDHVGRHELRPRDGTKQPTDLLQRGIDVRAQPTCVQMAPYVRAVVRREKAFGEVGDLRDVRVPGRVCRRGHARPPPSFTTAESLGPVSPGLPPGDPVAGGTDAPCIRFRPGPDAFPLPEPSDCGPPWSLGRRWVSSGRSRALPRAHRLFT